MPGATSLSQEVKAQHRHRGRRRCGRAEKNLLPLQGAKCKFDAARALRVANLDLDRLWAAICRANIVVHNVGSDFVRHTAAFDCDAGAVRDIADADRIFVRWINLVIAIPCLSGCVRYADGEYGDRHQRGGKFRHRARRPALKGGRWPQTMNGNLDDSAKCIFVRANVLVARIPSVPAKKAGSVPRRPAPDPRSGRKRQSTPLP